MENSQLNTFSLKRDGLYFTPWWLWWIYFGFKPFIGLFEHQILDATLFFGSAIFLQIGMKKNNLGYKAWLIQGILFAFLIWMPTVFVIAPLLMSFFRQV